MANATSGTDRYLVPAGPSAGEFRDRGSKFLAALKPVTTAEAALAAVAEQRSLHTKCNHHVYAYRLGEGTDVWRANDDGEPNGTGGKPILAQIDKAGLSDLVIVVSRDFGGTKLGTSGLINAYREAAARALASVPVTERLITVPVRLRFGYALMSPVMGALSLLGLDLAASDFGVTAEIDLLLPRSEADMTLRQLKAAVAQVYPEEVDADFVVPGLDIRLGVTDDKQGAG